MEGHSEWYPKIFATDQAGFEQLALDIFRYQAANNDMYRSFVEALHIEVSTVSRLEDIPFLPIRFFKTGKVVTGEFDPQLIFESSGTTGMVPSRHYVRDGWLYERSFLSMFRQSYGEPGDWCIIGLLPSYLERKHSSLVYMVEKLVQLSGRKESGFYLNEFDQLGHMLEQLEKKQQKTWLIGVSFALLDFAASHPMQLNSTVVVETGGMKGRGEELIREELHQRLAAAFQKESIHSEYGMTELLSQAYSSGSGIFRSPGWMKVLVREDEDPFVVSRSGSGIINIIDLANIHSCSFIATDDVGRVREDGSFEVLGRVDGSDLRGCSLLLM
jgi:hypothetical protein